MELSLNEKKGAPCGGGGEKPAQPGKEERSLFRAAEPQITQARACWILPTIPQAEAVGRKEE